MAWLEVFMLALCITAYGVNGSSYLAKLAKHLKGKSDPDVVPMQDANTPVQVSSMFSLMNVGHVDREHNVIETEGVTTLFWNTGITWKPRKFNGIDSIHLPAKYFWIPSFQPLNFAAELKDVSPQTVLLLSNGSASMARVYRTRSLCDLKNIATGAKCHTKTGVWGYTKDQVVIGQIGPDISGIIPYFAGSKYEVLDTKLKLTDFPFDNKMYQIVDVYATVREKPGAHHGHGPIRAFFQWH